jgi:putative transposase
MPNNKLSLYLHLVWSTWDRAHIIHADIERSLYRCIQETAQKHGCTVLAINGTSNHVHVLLSIPTTISIAELVQQLKGVSSHFINNEFIQEAPFKWQGSYGAFSVSAWEKEKIRAYIRQQKTHHKTGELMGELEATSE